MASLLIVSGAPGTGKTTLAAALAAGAPRGLHLCSDVFYSFPAHPVDPATPEAHAQNTCVVRAVGRAAGAFVEGGYDVFLDGIFGPWFLAELGALEGYTLDTRGASPARVRAELERRRAAGALKLPGAAQAVG